MSCRYCKPNVKKRQTVSKIYKDEKYDNGLFQTPPMGWNSWNYFKENINEKMLLDMARAIKDSGLLEAGYNYINLDDYWEADRRDENGLLQCDVVRFPQGMRHTVDECNKLGFKVGIYSSNGTLTCQSLPASLGKEYMDARQFVKWGIEYLKYDFCYHKISSSLGPDLFGISVAEKGSEEESYIPCEKARLVGTAKLKKGKCNHHPNYKAVKTYITGLDYNKGMATFLVNSEKEGEYVISLDTRFRFNKKKTDKEVACGITVNDEFFFVEPGKIMKPCRVAPIRVVAKLKEGINTVSVFNPIQCYADSSYIQYKKMSDSLKKAVEDIGAETGEKQRPIAFSVCEWGFAFPWLWADRVSNLWRTTWDISANWPSISLIYKRNVGLYKYASPGHWNDPDMLEVGNGKLSLEENRAHFSLWCMMAAPLLLGNDVTKMKKEHLAILINKDLIAIDQDVLGKQAKRILSNKKFDVLVRPLADGSIALLALNKSKKEQSFEFDLTALKNEEYVSDIAKDSYTAFNIWEKSEQTEVKKLNLKIAPHDVAVFKLK